MQVVDNCKDAELMKAMFGLGIVWDLRPVPEHVRSPGPASGGRPRTNI